MGDSSFDTKADTTTKRSRTKDRGTERKAARPLPPEVSARRTIALLLRESIGVVSDALGKASDRERSLAALRAANSVIRSAREVVTLSRGHVIDWDGVQAELHWFLDASTRLQPILGSEMASLTNDVETATRDLEAVVDPEVIGVARVLVPLRPSGTTDTDRVEITTATIAAATKDATTASSDVRDPNKRHAAIQAIETHLRTARSAFERVSNRSLALALNPSMGLLKSVLDRLEQTLQIEPAIAWEEGLARMFDAELELRKSFGLAPTARAYSGKLSPKDAAALVSKRAANPSTEIAGNITYSTPQAAVGGIVAGFSGIYDAQSEALNRFNQDIRERIPASKSVFDAILDLVVEVAIGAMTGGIGNLVGRAMGKALSNGVEAKAGRGIANKEARDEIVKNALADSDLYRGVVTDSAKDAAKAFFRNLSAIGKSAGKTRTNAQDPLNGFVQRLRAAVAEGQNNTAVLLPELSNALVQLDLGELGMLAREVQELAPVAGALQYDVAMREWQNIRAQLASPGEAGADPMLAGAPRRHGEATIDGVLELGLSVSSSAEQTLDYMILRNGEPAAVRHLRDHARSPSASGLNRMYQFNLHGALATDARNSELGVGLPSTFVKVGIGVNNGFQQGSLSRGEMLALKMYAALTRPTVATMLVAELRDTYEEIPDAAAVQLVLAWIATAEQFTTKDLR